MLPITDANRRWWVLTGSSVGLFVLMLDSTVVSLALAPIKTDLYASTAQLQWVQNAYLLVIAALTVTLGRAGDVFGRRRVFQAGILAFAVGCVVSATATVPDQLIAGRAIQGAGAAALLALSLALVNHAFPAEQRPRALGIWAAVSSIALAFGPLIGGSLVEVASWRWLFWIDLPALALGFAIVAVATPESRDPTALRRFDLPGLVTLTVGLVAVVLALVQGKVWGWSSPATVGTLVGGVAALVAFWMVEHRVRAPIVDFALFRNGPYFGASAAAFALVGAYWTVMFFQPQYFQLVLHYSTFEAGLLVLPVTVPMLALSPVAGRLIDRFGARPLMTAGMLFALAGMLIVTRVDPASGYRLVLPGLALFGISLGLVYAPMSVAAMAAMPEEKAGLASGVLGMVRILAGALVLAATGALFQHIEVEELADKPKRGFDAAFADAIAGSTWLLVGVLAVGALLTWLFVRSAAPPHPEPDRHRMHHRRFHL